jgi:microcompartment protein CcmL/EutN
MRHYPTIAVLEFGSIADGLFCTDALLKRAPIAMIKSGTVSGGRYLVIIGGSTASVEESLNEALALGQAGVLDHAFLPDVHSRLHDALLGERTTMEQDSVAILETDTVAANVSATEQALKGTDVRLVELRLADYEMSGKAISLFNGPLHEIEAAMGLAVDFLQGRKEYVRHRIISLPHEMLTKQLASGTQFATAKPQELEGEEVS